MNHDFEIKLEVDCNKTYSLGEEVKGDIFLRPLQDIDIKSLGYKLYFEIRGLTETKITAFFQKTVFIEQKLKKGAQQRYPFSFTNNQFQTYRGRNVEMLIRLEAKAKLEDKVSENFLLSKIGYINNGEEKSASCYLNFESNLERYKIVQNKVDLKLSSTFKIVGVMFSGLFILIGLFSEAEFYNKYKAFIWGGGLTALLLSGLYGILESVLIGQIQAELIDIGKGQFQIKLKNKNNWKGVEAIEVEYSVGEEVTDRRGTSTSTELYDIHVSEIKRIKRPGRDTTVIFDYPKKTIPIVRFENVRTYWSVDVKVVSSVRLNFNYENEFLVKRE